MSTLTKKIIIVFIILAIPLSLMLNYSYALVNQSADFFVNDTANVLSPDTENYIINMNKSLESKTGAQVVVVTVTSLDGLSIEDYATQLFRKYGIGSSSQNNGVLFLISTGDRQVRIEVGYGLEGKITDGKAGRILDNYVIPYLKDNDWDSGIENGFNAILKDICSEYDITINGATEAENMLSEDTPSDLSMYSMFFSIAIFFICLIARFMLKSNKSKLLFGFGLAGIATIIEIALGFGLSDSFIKSYPYSPIIYNFMFMIVGMFGKPGRGGYYGGGYHGGGGSFHRRITWWWRLFWRRPVQAEDFKLLTK